MILWRPYSSYNFSQFSMGVAAVFAKYVYSVPRQVTRKKYWDRPYGEHYV